MSETPKRHAPRSLMLCRASLMSGLEELASAFAVAHFYPEVAPEDYDESEWDRVRVLAELLLQELQIIAPDA